MHKTIIMSPTEAQTFAAQQQLSSWLQSEHQRLDAQLSYVRGQLATQQQQLSSWLMQTYGVDASRQVVRIDAQTHTIEIDAPDAEPAPAESGGSDG